MILGKHQVGVRHAHSSSAWNCREWLGKLIRRNFTERKGCPAEVRSQRSSRNEKLKRLCNFVAHWRLRAILENHEHLQHARAERRFSYNTTTRARTWLRASEKVAGWSVSRIRRLIPTDLFTPSSGRKTGGEGILSLRCSTVHADYFTVKHRLTSLKSAFSCKKTSRITSKNLDGWRVFGFLAQLAADIIHI